MSDNFEDQIAVPEEEMVASDEVMPAPEDEEVDENAISIEWIHTRRVGADGEIEYLVKWTGMAANEVSWERRANLLSVPDYKINVDLFEELYNESTDSLSNDFEPRMDSICEISGTSGCGTSMASSSLSAIISGNESPTPDTPTDPSSGASDGYMTPEDTHVEPCIVEVGYSEDEPEPEVPVRSPVKTRSQNRENQEVVVKPKRGRKRKTPVAKVVGVVNEPPLRPIEINASPDAEEVIGAFKGKRGEIMYMVRWRGTTSAEMVPSSVARERFPQLVIQFLQSRIKFL